jgi:hypothetical protein
VEHGGLDSDRRSVKQPSEESQPSEENQVTSENEPAPSVREPVNRSVVLGDPSPDVVEFVLHFGSLRDVEDQFVVVEPNVDFVDLPAVDVGSAVFVREDPVVERQ